MRQEKVLY